MGSFNSALPIMSSDHGTVEESIANAIIIEGREVGICSLESWTVVIPYNQLQLK